MLGGFGFFLVMLGVGEENRAGGVESKLQSFGELEETKSPLSLFAQGELEVVSGWERGR